MLNRFAVACLQIKAGDNVLEIGFGPGDAIKLLSKSTQAETITGIDPSNVMLEEAAAKNASFIRSGRVRLLQGDVLKIPFSSQIFSQVFAVSTFHDWEKRECGLREVRRVLQGEGRLVLCLRRQPRFSFPWSFPGLTQEEVAEDQRLIARNGFHDVQILEAPRAKRIICLVARAAAIPFVSS